jgi:hypothetical protein
MGWCDRVACHPSDPCAAGAHPVPQDPDHRSGPGDPAAGEAEAGRRDQVVVGGVAGVVQVGAGDGRSPHRRRYQPGEAGGVGQGSHASQDPCAHRGVREPLGAPPQCGAPAQGHFYVKGTAGERCHHSPRRATPVPEGRHAGTSAAADPSSPSSPPALSSESRQLISPRAGAPRRGSQWRGPRRCRRRWR